METRVADAFKSVYRTPPGHFCTFYQTPHIRAALFKSLHPSLMNLRGQEQPDPRTSWTQTRVGPGVGGDGASLRAGLQPRHKKQPHYLLPQRAPS